jgi:hypothetical protein
MSRAGKLSLWLFLVLLSGCAAELQSREASQSLVEKERQEEKKETAPPTFTYRP